MKIRAPHGCNTWTSGHIGFGHALLKTSPTQENAHQPGSLDRGLWITADARIDDREKLIKSLHSAGQPAFENTTDADLILLAYLAFDNDFLNHLSGDFSFALWDMKKQLLICARDHFGVRPFFYYKTNNVFIFASDIDVLLQHPSISNRYDDIFLGDFLLFGCSMEAEPTVYHDIRRLPAASFATVKVDGCSIERYWSLPQYKDIRYKNIHEYSDHFMELFTQAVTDRSSTENIALELSGGLDSTSIAAIIAAQAKASGHPSITAHTLTCHELFPNDQEAYYAEMAALYLGIPVEFQANEDNALFHDFDNPKLHTSEPFINPDLAAHHSKLARIANTGAHVMLTGQGGDALYSGSSNYFADLLRQSSFIKFIVESCSHIKHRKSIAGMGLRSSFMRSTKSNPWQPDFPTWINTGFAERTQLHDRWNSWWHTWNHSSDTCHQLTRPWLSHLFESYEAPNLPVVVRHPFFDLRLVEFFMGLPNHVKHDKKILRVAMQGKLPDAILSRPKTALAGDHIRARLIMNKGQNSLQSNLAGVDNAYIEPLQYQQALIDFHASAGAESTWSSWLIVAPIALNHWLRDTN